VRDGEVVGEGWHERAGGPHAEVVALEQAGERARGATVYVTLEPCAHHGRTPPCTEALLAAGIARVVYAISDPGHRSGGGAQRPGGRSTRTPPRSGRPKANCDASPRRYRRFSSSTPGPCTPYKP